MENMFIEKGDGLLRRQTIQAAVPVDRIKILYDSLVVPVRKVKSAGHGTAGSLSSTELEISE